MEGAGPEALTGQIPSMTTVEAAVIGQKQRRRWDDDARNPQNWSQRQKYIILALVSYIDFLTPLTSMMFAPGLPAMQRDLRNYNDTLATLAMTIYVLGFGVGPLLFAPMSEVHGRSVVYKGCLAMFLVFTIACAIASTIDMLIAFRFIAGCFGAAPVAIGGAMVYDLFRVHERGAAMAVYQAGPILGNILGPPLGGVIVQHQSWRWVFWIVAILSAFALICSILILKETHAPVIMASLDWNRQSAEEVDENTSLLPCTSAPRNGENTRVEQSVRSEQVAASTMLRAFRRPLTLLFLSPVCTACALVIIWAAGITNLIFSSLARIFLAQYGFSTSVSGLMYLGATGGLVMATFIFGYTSDRISRFLTDRNGDKREPEFRLPAMVVGFPLLSAGLGWYGWAAYYRVFWFVPVLGLNALGMGIAFVQLSLQAYIVDSFTEFAASALAATTVARSIGGALIPLAGPVLYQRMGLGWSNTALAVINLMLCLIPGVLYIYGKAWRENFSLKEL